jgi:hypothetical protein
VEQEVAGTPSQKSESVAVDYPAAWKRYWVWRWMWMGAWLALFPVELMIGIPLSRHFRSSAPFGIIAVVFMVAFAFGGIAINLWSCPRCGNTFHARGMKKNLFARRCLHCGLPKRAPGCGGGA